MGVTSYLVRLADRSKWQIIPAPETEAMVARAAEIMGLSQGKAAGARRLFVVGKREEEISSDTPVRRGESWHSKAFGYGTFLFSEKTGDVVFEIAPTDDHVKVIRQIATLIYPLINNSVSRGGLPVHAGILARDGKCVILPASGNTGKSTCCRRIIPPWSSPGDDLGLIVAVDDQAYKLHPLPTWSDFLYYQSERRWEVQESYKFSSIFFLEQGAIDQVLPIRQCDAAIKLFDAANETWLSYMKFDPGCQKADRIQLFDNACAIARRVPSHILRASLTGQFWTEIEKAMNGI